MVKAALEGEAQEGEAQEEEAQEGEAQEEEAREGARSLSRYSHENGVFRRFCGNISTVSGWVNVKG